MNKYLLLLILCTPVLSGMDNGQEALVDDLVLSDISDDESCEFNVSDDESYTRDDLDHEVVLESSDTEPRDKAHQKNDSIHQQQLKKARMKSQQANELVKAWKGNTLRNAIQMGSYDLVAELISTGMDLEPQELIAAVAAHGQWISNTFRKILGNPVYADLCTPDVIEKAVQEENKTAQNKMLATIEAARLKRKA